MMFDRDSLNQLYRYAYTLTGDESSAYDLVQDTVERCLRRPAKTLEHPQAYAKRVMRNHFIDMLRRNQRNPEDTSVDADIEPIAIDTYCLEQMAITRDQLEHAWRLLDRFEREILYFWAVEGMTAEQIANVLDSRRGTILSRIHRLRNKLRNVLGEQSDVQEVG